MSVAAKLLSILAFVAHAPLVVFALSAHREHERALEGELAALHQKAADDGARTTELELDSARRTVRGLAGAIPWAALSAEERGGALLLVYEQLDDIVAVSLFDDHGTQIGASAYRDGEAHPRASAALIDELARALPHPAADAPTLASPLAGSTADPVVPIAIPVAGPGQARWTLAVAYSLRGVCRELAASAPEHVASRLEAGGRVVCGTSAPPGDHLTASAEVAPGWTVTVEEPEATALASLHRVRVMTVLWLGLGAIGALVAGLVLVQGIRKPLRQLTAAAEAVAGGNFEHRVPVESRDELGALATSFNRMSEEIRAWNQELQQRVETRTAELKEAQEQLLQSRKLGAMAALGAGVAHEINNPLTGVVGLTQLLLAKKDRLDEKTVRSLTSIEREALRIRDIVERLAALAQESVADAQRLDPVEVVAAAADEHAPRLAASKIEIERAFASGVPAVLGNASQLRLAIGQLVDNSLRAMPDGGKLKIAVRSIENELVAIDVEDTGRGIAPEVIDKIFEPFFTTKDHWRGAGLGLASVHRIVEAHRGRIRVSSKLGAGTTMTVTLPAARRAAHLS